MISLKYVYIEKGAHHLIKDCLIDKDKFRCKIYSKKTWIVESCLKGYLSATQI